jgi:3-mercaptopyruvate sulfurtransferase SseA
MVRTIRMIVVVAGLLLLTVQLSVAAEQEKADPYTVVTSEQLKAMLDRQEQDMVVIDARNPDEYQEVHIRTAVNIPWSRLEKDRTLLIFPKETKLVFYCNGFK